MPEKWFAYELSDEETSRLAGPCATREEAEAKGFETFADAEEIYTGQMLRFVPSIDVEAFLDEILDDAETLYDEADSEVEKWPNANGQQIARLGRKLNSVLESWLKEIGQPARYTLEGFRRHRREDFTKRLHQAEQQQVI